MIKNILYDTFLKEEDLQKNNINDYKLKLLEEIEMMEGNIIKKYPMGYF